jgi:hypothetical protein
VVQFTLDDLGSGAIELLAGPEPGPGSGGGGDPSRLRSLELRRLHARVDFGAMPQLASAWLYPEELVGAETVAHAGALQDLLLGDDPSRPSRCSVLDQAWVLELLRSAPPSLASLRVCGLWTQPVADAIAGMGQLRALSLDDGCALNGFSWPPPDMDEHEVDAQPEPPRLGPGLLWGSLRGLCWYCRAPLPAEVRAERCLEASALGTRRGTPCAFRVHGKAFGTAAEHEMQQAV